MESQELDLNVDRSFVQEERRIEGNEGKTNATSKYDLLFVSF